MSEKFLLKECIQGMISELANQGSDSEQLKKWTQEGGYYIHFGDHKQVGIPTRDQYPFTPSGIYCYPLNQRILIQYEKGALDFAAEREYVHVLRPRDPSRILNLEKLTKQQSEKLISKIEKITGKSSNDFIADNDFFADSVELPPGEKFWRFSMWCCSDKTTTNNRAWRQLLLNAGVDGVVDRTGIIYRKTDQPEQAVFLGKNVVQHVATIIKNKNRFFDLVRFRFLQAIKKRILRIKNEKQFKKFYGNVSNELHDILIDFTDQHPSMPWEQEEFEVRQLNRRGQRILSYEFEDFSNVLEKSIQKIMHDNLHDYINACKLAIAEIEKLEKTLEF